MTYTLKGTDSQVLTQLSGSSSEGKGLTKNTHHPRMGEPWSPRELREPPTLVFLALSPAEKVGSHAPVPRREALGLRILLNPTCRKLGTRPWGQGHPRHLVNACAFGLHHLPSDHHPTMHAPTQARNEFGLVPKDAFISKSHPGTPHALAKAPP